MSHLNFVRNLAGKYSYDAALYEDMVQEGNVGLIEAADRYDGRGAFSTYAAFWVREMMRRSFVKRGAVTLPPRAAKNGLEIKKRLEKGESERDIARAFTTTVEAVRAVAAGSQRLEGWDVEVPGPEDSVGHERMWAAFGALLSERERAVLSRRREGYTLREVAQELKCSQQRVSEIEGRAVRRISQLYG